VVFSVLFFFFFFLKGLKWYERKLAHRTSFRPFKAKKNQSQRSRTSLNHQGAWKEIPQPAFEPAGLNDETGQKVP